MREHGASLEDVLDLRGALDRLGGDQSLLDELTALYIETSPALFLDIRAAIEAADPCSLRAASHALKGAAAAIGATSVAAAAEALERMARAGDHSGARGGCRELVEAETRLRALLAQDA